MSARSFCTVTASTKRNADLGSGRTGAPATNLASLAITPLWPISAGSRDLLDDRMTSRIAEMKECYHVPAAGESLPDVIEGDVLTVSSVDYRVEAVREWQDIDAGGVPCLHILAQQIRGT